MSDPAAEPFLVIPENQFAYSAARGLLGTSLAFAATASPPLYVYGPAGIGKSHLLREVVKEVQRGKPKLSFAYATADRLAETGRPEVPSEAAKGSGAASLLVCEDLQTLDRSRWEALTRILLAWIHEGNRLLVTASRPPGEIEHIPAKLRNRFHGGICAGMQMPALSSRAELLRHFAQTRQLPLPEATIGYLAEAVPSSPRVLLSRVMQIEARARRWKGPITVEFAQELLREAPQAEVCLTLDEIAQAVALEFGLTVDEICSRSRNHGLVLPRNCAMLLSRELTAQPLGQIGRFYGARTHTTVSHGCERLKELLPSAPSLRQQLTRIRSVLASEKRLRCG